MLLARDGSFHIFPTTARTKRCNTGPEQCSGQVLFMVAHFHGKFRLLHFTRDIVFQKAFAKIGLPLPFLHKYHSQCVIFLDRSNYA